MSRVRRTREAAFVVAAIALSFAVAMGAAAQGQDAPQAAGQDAAPAAGQDAAPAAAQNASQAPAQDAAQENPPPTGSSVQSLGDAEKLYLVDHGGTWSMHAENITTATLLNL